MATKLSPVGSQFQVNQDLGGGFGINFFQYSPDIAPLSDGRLVVVYASNFNGAGTDVDIHAHFVNANGTVSGNAFTVASPGGVQTDPAVAARSDGGFTTVWQDFGTTTGSPSASPDIYCAVTNSAGTNTVTRALLMSTGVMLNPDIATLPDFRQIVVAELSIDASDHDIVFDLLGADGTTQKFSAGSRGPVDNALSLQRNPQVAAGSNRALVVYEDNNGEASANDFHITARLFNGTTETFGSSVLIADAGAGHTNRTPDVA
jgi:hypothetical protein